MLSPRKAATGTDENSQFSWKSPELSENKEFTVTQIWSYVHVSPSISLPLPPIFDWLAWRQDATFSNLLWMAYSTFDVSSNLRKDQEMEKKNKKAPRSPEIKLPVTSVSGFWRSGENGCVCGLPISSQGFGSSRQNGWSEAIAGCGPKWSNPHKQLFTYKKFLSKW